MSRSTSSTNPAKAIQAKARQASANQTRTSLGRPQAPKRRGAGVRPAVFYGLVGVLMATNALSVVGFLMSHDIANIMGGQNEQVAAAYETRIADLRTEIDRLYSRQYAKAGDINLQLQDLAQQQETLSEQHQYVKALAQMATELGIKVPSSTETAASAPVPASKPADIASVRQKLAQMQTDTSSALDALSEGVEKSTDIVASGLRKIGITPFPDDGKANDAMGGPFEPIDDASPDPTLDRANALYEDFLRFKQVRETLADAPVHVPLTGHLRVSSPFGPREDPFLHKPGFHSGMDLPEPIGTPVHSAGAGRISYAGWMRGYGNLVEITHQDGLKTRYGHLSAILVSKGDAVTTGEVVGRVGSTGRSTGPHLHFEVRRDGKPVNPEIYLNEGKALSRFL